MKTLQDDMILQESTNGNYVYKTVFEVEMTKDEVLKNKGNLQRNIDTLNEHIEAMGEEKVSEHMAKLKKKLDIEFDIMEESLKDIDMYVTKQIRKLKLTKNQRRIELRDGLENFSEMREKRLMKEKQLFVKKIAELTYQLKHDKKQIEIYKDIE